MGIFGTLMGKIFGNVAATAAPGPMVARNPMLRLASESSVLSVSDLISSVFISSLIISYRYTANIKHG